MSLSDCPQCWDTPCTCGAAYKSMSLGYKIRLAAAVLGISEAEMLVIWNRRAPDPRIAKLEELLREARDSVEECVQEHEAAWGQRLMHKQLPAINTLRMIDAALAEVGEG
jgi:hypothetical protein